MVKKLICLFVSIFTIGFIISNVSADEEIYYTNGNGVSMTREQYDFFGEMFYDGFQNNVTLNLYNRYLTNGYFEGTIVKDEYDEENHLLSSSLGDSPKGTVHETTMKKLTISKACGSVSCAVTVTLRWKGTPNVKSYDVIGALLYSGATLVTGVDTYLSYSGGTLSYGDEYYVGGGFGTSVKLQNSSTNMIITQDYDVSKSAGGVIYASYQHATSNITKATSQLYTVGYGGYGGVFHFYGAAVGKFDHMGGVQINV